MPSLLISWMILKISSTRMGERPIEGSSRIRRDGLHMQRLDGTVKNLDVIDSQHQATVTPLPR